jgi:hypothetical protein
VTCRRRLTGTKQQGKNSPINTGILPLEVVYFTVSAAEADSQEEGQCLNRSMTCNLVLFVSPTVANAVAARGNRFTHAFPTIIACFVLCFGCLRLQAVPVGPCSRVKGTGRLIALGLRPLTTHFSVWARERVKSAPLGVKKPPF